MSGTDQCVITADGKEYVLGFDKGKLDALLGLVNT